MGTRLVKDLHWIAKGLPLDWLQIGTQLVPDWHRIGHGLGGLVCRMDW